MKRHILGGLSAAFLMAASVQATQVEAASEQELAASRVEAAFDALVQEGFTGVALVAVQGDVVMSHAAGVADPQSGRALDAHSQFDIASITKTVTGMIAADQIAQGRITPDTTLGDVFNDAPPAYAPITLHQLLTHAAGVVGGVGDDFEALDGPGLRARAFQTPLVFEPGATYRYSNLGYSLAVQMLEQVSGQSYQELVQQAFQRVGAVHTGYEAVLDPEHLVRTDDGESLYDLSWGGQAPGWNLIGNGGLASTASDLMAWRLAYANGDLTAEGAVALAHQPYQAEDPEGRSHYGYGLVVETHPDLGRIYWHNGGSRHFNVHWREFADQGVVLVVLSNQWTVSADRMVAGLSRAYFESAS